MDDLISRRSAIDAIPQQIKGLGGESWMMTYRRSGYNDCVDACLDAIRHLPSAQPEIVRCKDCKYRDENWRRVSVKWLPCMNVRTGSNWYCGSAERG